MWEGDHKRFAADVRDRTHAAYQVDQRQLGQESFDRQPSHRNQEPRSDDPQLGVEPVGAALLLDARRYAIAAAARMRARKAPRHRRDVDLPSGAGLVESGPLEPAEKRLARSSGERDAARGLHLARRLADQHPPWFDGRRGDGSDAASEPAATAAGESGAMGFEIG